ncbi:helix-turn-helix domain-containing protein [Nostoc sp.]|uniref:helix-turn-helix domain-containing protein n=1 Tax=Nostoc sp. TaxID=1180 RepID=UPI002FFD236C
MMNCDQYKTECSESLLLMLDVLKVRIYPNKEQEISLAKSFGCSRFVWNFYLNKTNTQYEETGKGMTYIQMALQVVPVSVGV